MHTTSTVRPPTQVAIGEAARILGVSIDTVRRWESDGKLASTRTPGGQRRFRLVDVERLRAGP